MTGRWLIHSPKPAGLNLGVKWKGSASLLINIILTSLPLHKALKHNCTIPNPNPSRWDCGCTLLPCMWMWLYKKEVAVLSIFTCLNVSCVAHNMARFYQCFCKTPESYLLLYKIKQADMQIIGSIWSIWIGLYVLYFSHMQKHLLHVFWTDLSIMCYRMMD